MIQEPFGCTRARAFHLVLVYSHWEHLPACVIVFLCLQFPCLNGNNDTLALCCVYLISWLWRKRKRSLNPCGCLYTHKKCTGPSFDYITLSINCFIWGRKCLFVGNQLKNACRCFFRLCFGRNCCLFLLRKEKFSGISHGSESEGRERLDVVVDLCLPPLCLGVSPHAK